MGDRPALDAAASRPLASVIINNYNYGRYLRQAIESALGQTYQPLEVIVVDDGSTDDSREIIAAFGDRLDAVLKENGGQASALNAGFARCQGDVVIFLDADDVLLPDTVGRAVEALRADPGLAKLMYRMAVIDEEGEPTGVLKPAPHLAVPTGDLRREMMVFAFDVPRTATSGNAFPASILRQVMPIPDDRLGQTGADWYLAHVCPLYGRVGFLDDPGAHYRVHEANSYERGASILDLEHIERTVAYTAATGIYLRQHAERLGLTGLASPVDGSASFSTLAYRLIVLKLDPAAAAARGDSLLRLVPQGLRSARGRFDLRPTLRLMLAAWFLATAAAPRPIARHLALKLVSPERRRGVNRLLGRLHR